MAFDEGDAKKALEHDWRRTRRLIVIAFVAVVLPLFFMQWHVEAENESLAAHWTRLAIRLFLPLGGMLAAAIAVVRSPNAVAVLGASALCASLAALGIAEEWDTIRLMLTVAATVAAGAALILLLPVALRRLAVSLLIVIHFCGILSATSNVPPPGANPPWLTMQVWTRFFRPYLNFVYLNNAYHFYSPEPGPATLLFACVEYDDGTSFWEKIPNRQEHVKDPLLIEYYRRLSLVEAVNQTITLPSVPLDVARKHTLACLQDGMPPPEEVDQYLPAIGQYRPLNMSSKRFLESYAKFMAHNYARPDVGIAGIKIYRVTHTILHPGLFAQGTEADDHTLYMPFFLGEFDRNGVLKNAEDPYLYWLIPILGPENIAVTSMLNLQDNPRRAGWGPMVKVRDFLHIHAGSSPWEEVQ
jgi:hypothetical protein